MEICCEREELLKGIQTVQSIAASKTTLPVLSNILLETQAGALKLSSTDLEVGVRCVVKAEVIQNGALTVPAKTFGDFVRMLNEGAMIRLKAGAPARVDISSGKTKCSLVGLPKEDFPILPEFSAKESVSMEAGELREMLRKTIFSVSTDATRYVLNGVLFALQKGELRLVATDGRRLAFVSHPVANKTAAMNVIVPTKAVMELQRILGAVEAKEAAHFYATDNQVAVKVGDIVLVSRLIEGHFPNYDQVIPKGNDLKVQVSTKDLLFMTQRAALGVAERGGAVRYRLENGKLRVSASAQGRVEVEDEIAIQHSGSGLEIAFNPLFMIDILKNVDEEKAQLEFSSALNPGIVRPVGQDRYLCVVMPMRL